MQASQMQGGLSANSWRSLARRGLIRSAILAVPWWVLTGGEPNSWIIGAPAVLAAAAASVALDTATGWHVRLAGLLRFVPFFLWRTLIGSIDVAWRALHPRLPIAPELATYSLRLPAEGPARVFFANTVNLLPGTLSAELCAHEVIVHVLTGDVPIQDKLQPLEEAVAALFGHELASSGTPSSGEP
ncbi:MAG: Na+/H+ antiporter subunit E [Gemmataceae bacterium]